MELPVLERESFHCSCAPATETVVVSIRISYFEKTFFPSVQLRHTKEHCCWGGRQKKGVLGSNAAPAALERAAHGGQ